MFAQHRSAANPAGAPGESYRAIALRGRVEHASPHELVQILYEELVSSLKLVASAIAAQNYARKSEQTTRALGILRMLETSLDHERGADVAGSLQAVYQGVSRELTRAMTTNDAARVHTAVAAIEDLAGAWRSIRPS